MIEQIAKGLKQYFSDERQYVLEANIGGGIQGDAYLIKRITTGASTCERIVVKVLKQGPNWKPSVENREAIKLKSLKGAAHVAQHVDGTNDPETFEYSKNWIIMEWLENGVLFDFLLKAMENEKPLPNRVLYSVFMCLVRSCITLAWPDVFPRPVAQLETCGNGLPSYVYINLDMHAGNFVFGHFESKSDSLLEHRFVPILKMIDLGLVMSESAPTDVSWTGINRQHIGQVGSIMQGMAMTGRGKDDPTLDPQLAALIAMSVGNVDQRPALDDLERWLQYAIDVKSAAYYQRYMGGQPPARDDAIRAEGDDAIADLVRKLILDANTTGKEAKTWEQRS